MGDFLQRGLLCSRNARLVLLTVWPWNWTTVNAQ